MADVTAQEQLLLELINRARQDPLAEAARYGLSNLNDSLSPGTISSTAKQPLAMNALLVDAARAHSQWMLDTNTFSHTGVNNSTPTIRMQTAGYNFTGSWSSGENIAYSGTTGQVDATAAIFGHHEGLFLSAGHRVNILGDNFRETGVGQRLGAFTGSSGTTFNSSMVTEVFAKSGTGNFLLGVIINDADNDDFYDIGEGMANVTITATGTAGTFTTTSWSAGGYQMVVPAGTYTVTFSGAGISSSVSNVTMGSTNLKLDAEAGIVDPLAGANTFNSTGANESFDGGAGTDTVIYTGQRADFALNKNANGSITVTGPGAGTDNLVNIEILTFTDRSYNLGAAAKATTIAEVSLNSLIDLYVAYFNRVPEASGLMYWIDQFAGGKSLDTIAAEFYAAGIQNSATTGYTASMPLSDFIKILYQNVLGRSGATAPPASDVSYWEDQVNTGAVSREGLVARFLVDARQFYGDPNFGFVPVLLDNKVAFGKQHAVTYGVDYADPATSIQTTIDLAAAVTPTTIDAAVALMGLGADDYIV